MRGLGMGMGLGLPGGGRRAGGGGAGLYQSLVSYWALDEESAGSVAVARVDSIGGLTLTDTGTTPSDTGIVYPLAASLTSGNGERLWCEHDVRLSPGTSQFAIMAWLYLPSVNITRVPFSKYASADREFQLVQADTVASLANRFYFYGRNTVEGEASVVGRDVELTATNWYCVLAWFDNLRKKIGIQVNAGMRNEAAWVLPVRDGAQRFNIGGQVNMSQYTGRAGPVMVWKGYIPTYDEAVWLYNSGSGRTLADMQTAVVAASVSTLSPTVSTIAADGYAGTVRANSSTFRDSAIATVNIGGTDYQALAYWNSGGNLVLGKRVQGGAWTLYAYDGTGGRPTIGPVTADEHNVCNIGLDPNGYLHVAYDHHNVPLNYRKSDAPLSIWSGGVTDELAMVGTNESQVSYPTFVNDPSGALYFLFRDGISGNGNLYFYKYDHATAAWAAATGTGTGGLLIDGVTSGENPYWVAPRFDTTFGSGGYMHLFWVWRDTTAVATNHDICHVRWDGTNWTVIDDTAQTIPITTSNDTVVVSIAQNSGLSNQDSCDVDSQGRPHYAYFTNGTAGYAQLFHSFYDGTNWITRELTLTPTTSFMTDPYQVGRPLMLIDHADDRAYIVYHDEADPNNPNGLMLLYSAAGDYTAWTRAILTASDIGTYEPNGDYGWWRSSGVMQLCVAPWASGGAQWPIQLLEWTP